VAAPTVPLPREVLRAVEVDSIVQSIRSELCDLEQQLRAVRAEAARAKHQAESAVPDADGAVDLLHDYLEQLRAARRATSQAEIAEAETEAAIRVGGAHVEADELLASAWLDVGTALLSQTVDGRGAPPPRPPTAGAEPFEIVDFDPGIVLAGAQPGEYAPGAEPGPELPEWGSSAAGPVPPWAGTEAFEPRPYSSSIPAGTPALPGPPADRGAPLDPPIEPGGRAISGRPARPAEPRSVVQSRSGSTRPVGPPQPVRGLAGRADALQQVIPIASLPPMILMVVMLIIVLAWFG
jgi:hypothetical protein